MISFDAEYSVVAHFEIDEEKALEHGGINIDLVKKNCSQFSDWILEGITDMIELEDTDSVTVIPIEQKLVIDDRTVELNPAENYDVTISDATVNFKNEEIKSEENNENNNEI